MKNPIGFGVAALALAGVLVANGDDKKKAGRGGEKTAARDGTPTAPVDGWTGGPGKGLTYTSDLFSLKLANRSQIALSYADNKGAITVTPAGNAVGARTADTLGFDIRRARTSLSGHIWSKSVTYKLQTDWTDGVSIKDLWVNWNFHETDRYALGIRFGQQKIAFGNEWYTSSGKLEFVDRSRATKTFSNSRSRGLTLHGDMGVGGSGGALGWSISAFNNEIAGAGRNAGEDGDKRSPTALAGADYNDDTDDRANYSADIRWSSDAKTSMGAGQGDLDHDGHHAFGAGISYYYGFGRRAPAGSGSPLPAGTPVIKVETNSGNVWAGWKSGSGIAVSGEYFLRSEDATGGGAALVGANSRDSNGFTITASWVAAPVSGQNQWGAGLRFSEVYLEDPQLMLTGGTLRGSASATATANNSSTVNELEAVVNCYHHGHGAKTQLGITWQSIDPAGTPPASVTAIDNYIFTLQNTLVF